MQLVMIAVFLDYSLEYDKHISKFFAASVIYKYSCNQLLFILVK